MAEKKSLIQAIKNAQELSSAHLDIMYWVMDKPGKRAVVTGVDWICKSMLLEHWHVHCRFYGGKQL